MEETFVLVETNSDRGDGLVHDSFPAVQRRPDRQQDSGADGQRQRPAGAGAARVALQAGAGAAAEEGGRQAGTAATSEQRGGDGQGGDSALQFVR